MPGKLEIQPFQSEVLKGNALGDPSLRDLYVYLPPGYSAAKKYPALLAITGFTGTGAALFNPDPLQENLKDKMDRLIGEGKCPPVVVVAPDCFTRVGGSQYLNSTATGRYEDYLVQEIIPWATERYSLGPWGVFGKSSGGYGAIVLGMKHPEIFRVLADHSGDSNFELCYLPDFGKALNAFKRAGGVEKWLEKLWRDVNHKRKEYFDAFNILGMAACYSPNPSKPLGIDFPFCLETGVFQPEVWKRWQEKDPVKMVALYEANLRKLHLIYIDCGNRDEFYLQWGARALAQELKRRSIAFHYEEFDDGHMSIPYRYDVSVPLLVNALNKL
jgi:enterochelin esterase-like enzyme